MKSVLRDDSCAPKRPLRGGIEHTVCGGGAWCYHKNFNAIWRARGVFACVVTSPKLVELILGLGVPNTVRFRTL